MAEPTFRALEILAKPASLATGTRITYRGVENIPDRGGAVIAINHTSYVDFLPAGAGHASPAPSAAVHDQGRDAAGEGGQLPDQAHRAPFRWTATPGRAPTRWPCSGCARESWSGSIRRPRSAAASSSRSSRRAPPGWPRSRRPDRPGDRLGCAADLDQGPSAAARPPQGADHCAGRRAVACRRRHRAHRRRAARLDDHAAAPGAAAVSAPGRARTGCRTGWAGAHRRWPRRLGSRPTRPPRAASRTARQSR